MSTKNNQTDDPRNSALETRYVLPKTWHRESNGSSYIWLFMRGVNKLTYISSFELFIDGAASSSGMFLSGLIMVTRNRYYGSISFLLNGKLISELAFSLRLDRFLAWPSLLFGLMTSINEHPLRSETSTLHGWSNLAYVLIYSHQSIIELNFVFRPVCVFLY